MLLGYFLLIMLGIVLAGLLYWAYVEEFLPTLIFLLVVLGGVVSCNQSEWYQSGQREADARHEAQEKVEATPHVIREADGCKVYAFKSGGLYHYFTRCPEGTTTEGHHQETTGSGKNARTKDVSETITVSTVHKEN